MGMATKETTAKPASIASYRVLMFLIEHQWSVVREGLTNPNHISWVLFSRLTCSNN
jgi:hypothetical protein